VGRRSSEGVIVVEIGGRAMPETSVLINRRDENPRALFGGVCPRFLRGRA
jgi:hypothetical protein